MSGFDGTVTGTGNSENETERRRKVAEEKVWGAIIEAIERMRRHPVARSIMVRLFDLHMNASGFLQMVTTMGTHADPMTTLAASFTTERTNFLIKMYNSIIKDLQSHLEKRDSYVETFSSLEELDSPTINDVAKTVFMIVANTSQIMAYMLRWIE